MAKEHSGRVTVEAFPASESRGRKRSGRNQRQYCEAEDLPQKALQLAHEVQSRAASTGAQAAIPARRRKSQAKSYPKS